MLLVAGQKLLSGLRPLVSQAAGELGEGCSVLGESMGLAVVHHLQIVLNCPQKHVPISEYAILAVGQ